MSYFNIGYGICLDNVQFKPDAAYLLLSQHMTDIILEQYTELFETSDGAPAMLTPQTADAFAKEYQNDETCARGLPALIVDIINEERDFIRHPFTYEDQCIYIPATVPIDNEDRDAMLTQKDIQRILSEYLTPLVTESFECNYLDITE
jgi:ATP-dependent protease Clp ATPase subunit